MIESYSDCEKLYVQYGCGLSCPDGWQNFDASPRLWIENSPGLTAIFGKRRLFPKAVRYGDIVSGLPIKTGSARGVYCSHVLEHIDRANVVGAVLNTFQMLKPGGIFRLVVPDLAWRAENYVAAHKRGNTDAADLFMQSCHLGRKSPASGLIGRLRRVFGNSDHRWMYDEAAMTGLLAAAGFTGIRRCSFGDAEDPAFALVEDEGRFVDNGHTELALEARKPR